MITPILWISIRQNISLHAEEKKNKDGNFISIEVGIFWNPETFWINGETISWFRFRLEPKQLRPPLTRPNVTVFSWTGSFYIESVKMEAQLRPCMSAFEVHDMKKYMMLSLLQYS